MESSKSSLGHSSLSFAKQESLPVGHGTPPRSGQLIKKEGLRSPMRFKPEPDSQERQWLEASQASQASQEYVPRHQENPFAVHEDEVPEEMPLRGGPLRDLAQDVVPERLEAGVRVGIEVLAEVQKPLEGLRENRDAQNWLKQIENVRNEAIKSRTVVGVVGNTGQLPEVKPRHIV